MRVLIACEYSGRTREAFRARGHDAWSVDLLPAEDQSPWHIIGDVFEMIKHTDPWDLMIAHPPCTYRANSGVRWLYKKETVRNGPDEAETRVRDEKRWANMREGAKFFGRLLACNIPKIAVENPIMHSHGREIIGAYLRSQNIGALPTHFVQPWWFGDRAFKATGFTLKGLDPLVKPDNHLTPPEWGTAEYKEWSVIHNASPGPNRWKERSRTFPGIAAAMAAQWG